MVRLYRLWHCLKKEDHLLDPGESSPFILFPFHALLSLPIIVVIVVFSLGMGTFLRFPETVHRGGWAKHELILLKLNNNDNKQEESPPIIQTPAF